MTDTTATATAIARPADPSAAAAADTRPAEEVVGATGYFARPSTLPMRAPDFRQIRDEEFLPAFDTAMRAHNVEIARIRDNPAAPTFDNTIVALETSGQMLNRVAAVFFALTGAHTNDTLDAVNTEIGPRLAAHSDAIQLDPKLFARVKAVYDNRAALNLDRESLRLLERTYENMVQAGAQLTDAQKEQVRAINAELSTLTTDFSQRVRAATVERAVVVEDRAQLAGLTEAEIAAAATAAQERGLAGRYVLALQNTTQQPILPNLENRALRERVHRASVNRADQGGPNDTRALIARIAQLRAQKAALFGERDWASYVMFDRMVREPQAALAFMNQMVPAIAATQRREAGVLNEKIRQTGGNFTVQPWDWYRYAEMVRRERYSIDDNAVRPYFEINSVLENGVFHAANQMFGLTFAKRTDLPVYHPDVSTYTVFDQDGSELGIFYFDPYQRPSKRGGAWMSNFVDQSHLLGTKPVIYNVLNIPKAPEGEPQLVSFDNVVTMFHEFGHALHGFFADQRYASISGTATARDFVEYPSQLFEMPATDPAILANYARHYQTGQPIPADLIRRIEEAGRFNQGYDFGEVVAAALLDMRWHALSPEQAAAITTPEQVDAFERQALAELGLETELVPPRYRSNYFNHIFSSPEGYSAGYYSYLWTQMLDHDSREWLRQNGGLTRANGQRWRDTVLSRGGTMDYLEMYRNFTGREPNVRPLLEARGLTGEQAPR
ncbi:M3 family peptidase [Erythrobacteraceae bacterium CFH 75059]|nr:M3 family peptidase [Erythrobacteraceae bacterium CFH 75059]